MKNIIVRSLTGSILVISVVGTILLGEIYFAALFFLITILGTYEFYKMFHHSKYRPQLILGTIISIILYTILVLIANRILPPISLSFVVALLFVIPIRELYRQSEEAIPNIALSIFGILYVGLTFGMMNLLFFPGKMGIETYHFILAFFIILWTSDTFAYLSGISFGKHKLFERISPKKSWEGFFGGLIAAILAAYILSIFFKDINSIAWIGYAFVVVISGVYGDLIQSMFKRSLGLKDSGKILPGHGGILDRFDAVFVAIPIAIAYIMLIV